MNYFFDTSALVKIYHDEKESDKALKIYNLRLLGYPVIRYCKRKKHKCSILKDRTAFSCLSLFISKKPMT
jgi:hypothetical protein